MKLFGQLVRTVVNVATIPVAVAKDVTRVMEGEDPKAVKRHFEKLKEEALESPDER